MLRTSVLFVLMLLAPGVALAAADPARYMPAELIAETLEPAPGSRVLMGLRMTPRPGWHGYWSNPGDSGIAPTVEWSALAGVRFGPLLHSAPSLLSDGGVDSYVHEGEHVLLTWMSVPEALARGTKIPVIADLSWAACTATKCVPLQARLHLDLTVGDGSKSADWALLKRSANKLPRAAPEGSFARDGDSIRLILPTSLALNGPSTRFFAEEPEAFDTARASVVRSGGALVISGYGKLATGKAIRGVVTDGRTAYRLILRQSEAPLERAEGARLRVGKASPTAGPTEPKVQRPLGAEPGSSNANRALEHRRTSWLSLVGVIALIVVGLAIIGLPLSRRQSRIGR